MKNLSLNLRNHRRITPLGASTLLWLNARNGIPGQDKATAARAVRAVEGRPALDSKTQRPHE